MEKNKDKKKGVITKEMEVKFYFSKDREVTSNCYGYTSNDVYKNIFGKTLKGTKKYPWKRKIIKITSPDASIKLYRIWKGTSQNVKSKDTLFLDNASRYALLESIKDEEKKQNSKIKITLSKGSKIMYYWNHFDNVIRVSFKLGFISLILGLLSIVLSVISFIL